MTLIDIKGVPYLFWEQTTSRDKTRSWRLHKVVPWGKESRTVTLTPTSCSCEDQHYRRDGLLPVPCKHIRATRHIVQSEKQ